MEYFQGTSSKEESPLINKSTSTNKPEDTRKDKDDRSELKFDKGRYIIFLYSGKNLPLFFRIRNWRRDKEKITDWRNLRELWNE